MIPLVIVRPEPGASASAARARDLGLDVVVRPLFAVQPTEWEIPEGSYDGLVITSANALRHGGSKLANLTHLPVHAVGAATAEAARASGFTIATVGDQGAEALAEALPTGRYLHLCGRAHKELPGTDAVVVYDAAAIDPAPSFDDLEDAVIAVHSPRAGERLAEAVADRARFAIAAISPNAAAAVGGGWRTIAYVSTPDDGALLALAARMCQSEEA